MGAAAAAEDARVVFEAAGAAGAAEDAAWLEAGAAAAEDAWLAAAAEDEDTARATSTWRALSRCPETRAGKASEMKASVYFMAGEVKRNKNFISRTALALM